MSFYTGISYVATCMTIIMNVCDFLQVMGRKMDNQEPRVYWYVLPSAAARGGYIIYELAYCVSSVRSSREAWWEGVDQLIIFNLIAFKMQIWWRDLVVCGEVVKYQVDKP